MLQRDKLMKTKKFKVGFEYDWAKMPDGTYKLFGVPVFQETVDSRGGKAKKYTAQELKSLVDHHYSLQTEKKHVPSVHWGHNSGSKEEKEKLGEAVNFRLGELFGKKTIFCDIEDIEPEVFEKIKKGKLPHVSVEILPTDPPRIGSIAFLSSNAPYFTLPNIRAGKELKTFSAASGPILFEAGDTLEFVSCFIGELSMKKEFFMEENPMEEEKGMEPSSEEMMAEGGDLESRVSALEEKIDQILSMLQGEGKEPMGSAEPVAQEEEGQMGFGKMDMFLAIQEAVECAVTPLKKDLKKVKEYSRELELERNAERALRYFDAIGLVVDPQEFRTKLKEKVKKYGVDAGLEYIEELKEYGQRAPVVSKFEHGFSKPDPESLQKYKEEGSDVFQAALTADREYAENASHFAKMGLTREHYIEGAVSEIRAKKGGLL